MTEDLAVLVTSVGTASGATAAAAALACVGSDRDRAGLLIDLSAERPPRPSLIATAAAREMEDRLAAHLPDAGVASRGQFCHLALPPDRGGIERIPAALPLARGTIAVVHLPPPLLQPVLAEPRIQLSVAMLCADLTEDGPLTALVAGDLIGRGIRVAVLKQPLGWLPARLALLGAPSARGTALPIRLARRLLSGASSDPPPGLRRSTESGQALILALGGALALIAVTLVLGAIAGAVTGKGRAQRAADLAAISAARSMRDDLPRLLLSPTLPSGSPNPGRLDKTEYLERARAAATHAAETNGVGVGGLRISFPDRASFAPVRAKAVVTGSLRLSQAEVEASAVAEAAAPAAGVGPAPATASGGGYSGPLVYRNGEGIRPDVATAFDRMAAVARRDGLALVVNSGFRSDAEQAALFAAHPDPTWVAPPGKSLHRCATELDLGPESAYGWLAANATRFGFVQRYSWEAWHYGFSVGPPPCSAAGEAGGVGADGDGALAGSSGLPAFVPAEFR
ncbi:MAG TPA: D-alanyl-D-alanine carboxypeptidase family protein, partial [Solirubrobacterales bacterium]|nr:D-alanyl-D-alanine carboxypeptidase family protein [Solirubrobacterales bacterium]